MGWTLETVIFFLLLIDSIGANWLAWFGGDKSKRWYISHLRTLSRLFPVTKGWITYYLLLVLWIGYLTFY
jgi:hypothetical protein